MIGTLWSAALDMMANLLTPCVVAHCTPQCTPHCTPSVLRAAVWQAGWGKQLNYVVGFSRHGVTDVMKRYTKQWDQLKQRRTQVSEDWLSQQCRSLTAHCRRCTTAWTVHYTPSSSAPVLTSASDVPAARKCAHGMAHAQSCQALQLCWRHTPAVQQSIIVRLNIRLGLAQNAECAKCNQQAQESNKGNKTLLHQSSSCQCIVLGSGIQRPYPMQCDLRL